MNYLYPLVAAALLILPTVAYAQRMPADDPGIAAPSDAAPARRSDGGMVVKPPPTDPESIATPPAHADRGIDDATGKIDRKNRDALRAKPKLKPKPQKDATPKSS